MPKEYSIEELRIILKCRAARKKHVFLAILALFCAMFAIGYSFTLTLALIGRLALSTKVVVGALFFGGSVAYVICYLLVVRPGSRSNFLALRTKADEIECLHRDSIPSK